MSSLNCLENVYRPLLKEEKIEAAFLFHAGTVWASWESVYETVINDERFDVRLILMTSTTVETAHQNGAESFLVSAGIKYVYSRDIDFDKYVPHIVFFQFPYDAAFNEASMLSLIFKKRGSRIIYIPYGIEISDTPMARRDHFNSRVVENAWRIYVSGAGIKAEYDKYCRNRWAVRVTGTPKFDGVVHKEKYRLPDSYKCAAAGRKIVVWKMHFPKMNVINGMKVMVTPDINEYISFARVIEKYTDFFFIALPHPKMIGKMVSSDLQGNEELVGEANALISLLSEKENVSIDTSADYRNVLYNADMIITDRSGVMLEAAMLKVPLLYMKNKDYAEPLTLPVSEVMDSFYQGTGCADMESFMERDTSLDNHVKSKAVAALDRWFPFSDGKCGARIVEDIACGIQADNKDDELKIILYGTGEVASYYLNNQKYLFTGKVKVLAVSDSDAEKTGRNFYGYSIISPDAIVHYDFDAIVVMTEPYFYEIQKALVNDYYIDDRKILRLDEFVFFTKPPK